MTAPIMGKKSPCGICCIACGSRNLYVTDTRARDNSVYRSRKCEDCGSKFATVEEPYQIMGKGRKLTTKAEAMQEAVGSFVLAFQRMSEIALTATSGDE